MPYSYLHHVQVHKKHKDCKQETQRRKRFDHFANLLKKYLIFGRTNTNILDAQRNRDNDAVLILLSLFTCALLIHTGTGHWTDKKTPAFIAVIAGLQFLNFRLWWLSLLAAFAFIITRAHEFPRLANHANIELILSLLLILAAIAQFCALRLKISAHTISLSFRYLLVAPYVIAGFHKLNSGFFDMEGTCCSHVNRNLNPILFGEGFALSPTLLRVSQALTIVFEMIVPLGLLSYRSRKMTVVLLAGFHFYLSLCGFTNFSAFAGFLLVASTLHLSQGQEVSQRFLSCLKMYQLCAIAAASATFLLPLAITAETLNPLMGFIVGCIFNVGWVFLFAGFIPLLFPQKERKAFKAVPVIVVILITFWGMQGYLGLSAAGNLTMYSNLLTEKSRNNHYLIDTGQTKIWEFEEDYVTVIELSDDYRWEGVKKLRGYDLPLIEFRKQAKDWLSDSKSPISCKLLYKGHLIRIDDLEKSGFSKPEWWYRFIVYRPIPQKGSNECMW